MDFRKIYVPRIQHFGYFLANTLACVRTGKRTNRQYILFVFPSSRNSVRRKTTKYVSKMLQCLPDKRFGRAGPNVYSKREIGTQAQRNKNRFFY